MKLRLFLAALAASLTLFSAAPAQDAAPAPSPALTELQALVEKITTKLRAGSRTAEALAPELAEFDGLRAKYTEKNEDTAQIAIMHAMLYAQVLNDEDKARTLLAALVADYPGTKPAEMAARVLEQMSPEARAAAEAAQAEREAKLNALVGQPAPALTFKWSSKEGLKTLADLKGQVVVLDFWATWCGPCISSFPQVREHVTHFAGAPVTFLGVTSIQGFVANMGPRIDTKGDEAKEMALMTDFMKAKEMTWDVVISDQEVFNPDYGIEGIPFVAIIAPDGTVRHTGLHPGDPESDITAKVVALLKEFNLPLPAKS
ncbi:Thiol-disulfide oxidoreductase ResA [Lacunisphaera limnophila]|uniref:Thiol-disulfide oxidoreductase ResA n=1 Tax=Lacunisphaera limnophila TaxID=1838286 RepID=A0A1D8AR23_9BACT|nr:TlpA disulfide reductase family protein [Lacunisphaera limnophila]AOS43330.1 Thiol-disulfide oxidoreductase ResA [Lacunisphaera limnophila]